MRALYLMSLSVLVCCSASAQQYLVKDLGTLGGDYSLSAAVNDSGQVTGRSGTANGDDEAFLYSGGAMIGIGGAQGFSINTSGEVTGYLYRPDPNDSNALISHAFLYSSGVLHDLDPDHPDRSSAGVSINDKGDIAGGLADSAQRATRGDGLEPVLLDLGVRRPAPVPVLCPVWVASAPACAHMSLLRF